MSAFNIELYVPRQQYPEEPIRPAYPFDAPFKNKLALQSEYRAKHFQWQKACDDYHNLEDDLREKFRKDLMLSTNLVNVPNGEQIYAELLTNEYLSEHPNDMRQTWSRLHKLGKLCGWDKVPAAIVELDVPIIQHVNCNYQSNKTHNEREELY